MNAMEYFGEEYVNQVGKKAAEIQYMTIGTDVECLSSWTTNDDCLMFTFYDYLDKGIKFEIAVEEILEETCKKYELQIEEEDDEMNEIIYAKVIEW